jgi:hypothetical protein
MGVLGGIQSHLHAQACHAEFLQQVTQVAIISFSERLTARIYANRI